MTIWTHIAGNVWLATLIYAADGELEIDEWNLRDGKHGPVIPDERVTPELVKWIEREFEDRGEQAFQVGALYRMQLETGEDHAA